jgi:serine/threonine protein kinase
VSGAQEFVESRTAFIVIPLFAGGDMKRLLAAHKAAGTRLAEEQILNYLCQMLDAVTKIGQCGNAHRDLKPDNVRKAQTTADFCLPLRRIINFVGINLTRRRHVIFFFVCEQVFLTGRLEDLALADFGEVGAKCLSFTKGVTSPGGSPACLAPEVLLVGTRSIGEPHMW